MKKKTLIIAIICVLLVAAAVVLLVVKPWESKEPAAGKFVFRQGIDPDYPPFSYRDDQGNFTGFDVDFAKAVCDELGWELELVPVNWDTKEISLDNNEHDCVWSGMTIKQSMIDKGYVVSMPYYDNEQVILTKKDKGINSPADLAGKRVAVQLGTSGQDLLEAEDGQLALSQTFDGGAAITMESFLVCATELDAGGVDAVVVDLPVANSLCAKYPDFMILEGSLGSEKYGILFRSTDKEMCEKVEGAMKKVVENGTYEKLAEKYGLEKDVLCLLNK